jgi:hypothetical protein
MHCGALAPLAHSHALDLMFREMLTERDQLAWLRSCCCACVILLKSFGGCLCQCDARSKTCCIRTVTWPVRMEIFSRCNLRSATATAYRRLLWKPRMSSQQIVPQCFKVTLSRTCMSCGERGHRSEHMVRNDVILPLQPCTISFQPVVLCSGCTRNPSKVWAHKITVDHVIESLFQLTACTPWLEHLIRGMHVNLKRFMPSLSPLHRTPLYFRWQFATALEINWPACVEQMRVDTSLTHMLGVGLRIFVPPA